MNIKLMGDYYDKECCICFEEKNEWLTCNHKVCKKCFEIFIDQKCPICFQKVKILLEPKDKIFKKPPFFIPKLRKQKTLVNK
jgi:hypothetical protein